MNVVVIGAAGKTGKQVVERALAAGHTVTAFVHDPDYAHPEARVIAGDAADPADLRKALAGQDAVIDTLGGKTPYKKTDLETSTAQALISTMQSEGLSRLLVISMMGVGDSAAQAPFWYEYLLLPTFLHGATPDKTNMESAVTHSGLRFTIARPPVLSDDPATGSYQIVPASGKAHKITRADLAQFLVDQLTSDAYVGQAVVVANS